MKKVLLFIILLITPIVANAVEDVNYKVPQYYINAQMLENGDVKVQELYVMNGSFNGWKRNLVYENRVLKPWAQGYVLDFSNSSIYNATGIDDIITSAKTFSNEVTFSDFEKSWIPFTRKVIAQKGNYGIYTLADSVGSQDLVIYQATEKDQVAFYVSYTVKNAAVVHNDIAELYWTFIPVLNDKVKDLQVKVMLPKPTKSDNFRFWAHGPLTGEINALKNDAGENIGVIAKMPNALVNSKADIRMTFEKDMITNSNAKHSKTNAFDEILKVEKQRAEDANKERAVLRVKYYGTIILNTLYIIGTITAGLYIYLKYDKELKSSFEGKYYREFIDNYPVESVDYLMNQKITPNAMSASIMNLIYKKNISAIEITPEKKKKKEYEFTLKNEDNLSENEILLVKFLFEEVGENNKFTNTGLEKYAGDSKTYSKFTTKYNNWKNDVERSAKQEQFFTNTDQVKLFGTMFLFGGLASMVIPKLLGVIAITPIICLILGIIFFIYSLTVSKRTVKGNEDYRRWTAFKNFLLDFSIIPERELPEIALWERYMVYATVLGVADKVSKAMNVRITEVDPSGTYIGTPHFHTFMYINMNNTVQSALSNAYKESARQASANSSSSSGGGFGGGFSGGGGFGGGGGSAGGF